MFRKSRSGGVCAICCDHWMSREESTSLPGMNIRAGTLAGTLHLHAPPLELIAFGRKVEFRPLNERGVMLNQILLPILQPHPHWDDLRIEQNTIVGRLKPLSGLFSEEERSKQPSVFSVLRALVQEFRNEQDSQLSLIGAFGYDLLFQFDPIRFKLPRGERKDLHLFFCDDIHFMDRKKEQIERYQYDFSQRRSDNGGLTAKSEQPGPPHPLR